LREYRGAARPDHAGDATGRGAAARTPGERRGSRRAGAGGRGRPEVPVRATGGTVGARADLGQRRGAARRGDGMNAEIFQKEVAWERGRGAARPPAPSWVPFAVPGSVLGIVLVLGLTYYLGRHDAAPQPVPV